MAKKATKHLKFTQSPAIALVYRHSTPAALNLAKLLTEWFQERGLKVYTGPEQKRVPGTLALSSAVQMKKMGLILALGGDGTYLRAVRLLEGASVPILGVNLGSLGFLTPTRVDQVFAAIENTLQNKMELIPRSMLAVEVFRKGKKVRSYLALNDIVIERGTQSHLINTAIHAEKYLVNEVKADGIIISSPTGSTAYNLAAGGPLMHPEVKAFVVTPIAPHSLTSRPLIMPDHVDLRFQIVGRAKKGPCGRLVVDGRIVSDVLTEDEILVKRCPTDHLLIRPTGHNEFLLLREKLKFGDRA